jgi:hypothetical protein
VQHDPDVLRDRLRRDTAKMLKYDINALTAAQEVRLARATMLRLEIDDIETRKLNDQHQPFDIKAYVIASEALERLVGGDPEAPAADRDFSGAREELRLFLVQRAAAVEAREERESERLREAIARLVEANAELQAKLVAQSAAEQQPAPPQSNVVPIAEVPRKAAYRPSEKAWNDHYHGADHVIVPPAWP